MTDIPELRMPSSSKSIPGSRPPSSAKAAKRPLGIKRDPVKTKANILKAATAEFAGKGYSGARTQQIAKRARSNVRMIYHYFGSKEQLYLCVLEDVLAQLRSQELQLDLRSESPLEGIIRMFDFIDHHFEAHPELRNLLAFENLNKAACLKRSQRIPEMASPVLSQLEQLLHRGELDGSIRPGVDALQLYVAIVGIIYYTKSHGFTLSRIFNRNMFGDQWTAAYREQQHQILKGFLVPSPTAPL